MKKIFKKKKITIANQYRYITQKYSSIITTSKLYCGKMTVDIKIQPLKDSQIYEVRIVQKNGEKPKFYVIYPNIFEMTNGKKPPHVYEFNSKTCRLCLSLPTEVDLSKFIDYVIPWISDWFAYFELWCITGKWYGGGHKFDKNIKEI